MITMLLMMLTIAFSTLIVGIQPVNVGIQPVNPSTLPGVVQISDSICRLRNITVLQNGQTILGLHGDTTADFVMPPNFKPAPYAYDGQTVVLSEAIDVDWQNMNNTNATQIPVHVVKTDNPWRATLVNDGGGPTDKLEIYVKFHE